MARQVFATERLSLDKLRVVCGFPDPVGNSGTGRRDIVDALATISWFRSLKRQALGATAYAIGQSVEPEAYWKDEANERHHRNKWPKYERGLHKPSDALMAKAEAVFPGSSEELTTVLWSFLKRPPRARKEVAELQRRLRSNIRLLIEQWVPRTDKRKNGSISGFADVLERQAGLDALAAIGLLCMEAHLSGKSELALRWAGSLYRCMLLQGTSLLARGIARPLFELMEKRVLSSIEHQGWSQCFPCTMFIEAIGWLTSVAWQIDGLSYHTMNTPQRCKALQAILDGEYGWDLRFGLNPITRLAANAEPVSSIDLEISRTRENLFIWAWNMHHCGLDHPLLPPIEVLRGTDLWGISEEFAAGHDQ